MVRRRAYQTIVSRPIRPASVARAQLPIEGTWLSGSYLFPSHGERLGEATV